MKKIINSIVGFLFICSLVMMASCASPNMAGTGSENSGANEISSNSISKSANSAAIDQAAQDAYEWLCSQQDLMSNYPKMDGYVDSFEDSSDEDPLLIAVTYDQAVAAIAFLLAGDQARAEKVLSKLAASQEKVNSGPGAYETEIGAWETGYRYASHDFWEWRKHIGPNIWVAMAVMNYEKITGTVDPTYHDMAILAIEWCLKFKHESGGIAGGRTAWNIDPTKPGPGYYRDEEWISTEQNEDMYPVLLYFADSTSSEKKSDYYEAAAGVKDFLDSRMWDSENNRFMGGLKIPAGETPFVDQAVPMDVNPWGVLALGAGGGDEPPYALSLDYVEKAGAGTLEDPNYVYSLEFHNGNENVTINDLYDFDWEATVRDITLPNGQPAKTGPDIWFEGTAFMSVAYRLMGEDAEAERILVEMIKKQGTNGSKKGGIPYCLKGTYNNYWEMAFFNCISSTGWFIIAANGWNPFQGEPAQGGTKKVKAPVFTPDGGSYYPSANVTLASETDGAVIYYTLDGSDPDETSLVYSSAIHLTATTTVKAIAVKADMNNSDITEAEYIIENKVSKPVFDKADGTYAAGTEVEISSATPGALIYYTTDGSQPNTGSASGYAPVTLTLTENVSVKAYAVKSGMDDSDTVSAEYSVKAAAPQFSLPGGPYDFPRTVELSTSTAGAQIRYTLDGSTPGQSSPLYSGAITISAALTLKAIALKDNMLASDVTEEEYISNGPYSVKVIEIEEDANIEITANEPMSLVILHYSILGKTGQENMLLTSQGNKYIQENLIKRINPVLKLEEGDKIEYSLTYMITGQPQQSSEKKTHTYSGGNSVDKVKTPVISPGSNSFDEGTQVNVTISCDTADATIFYTTDGSEPNQYSAVYTSSISVNVPATVKAKAVKAEMTDSDTATAVYTVKVISQFIEKLTNGDVKVSVTYNETKDMVQAFVRRNGEQFHCPMLTGNVVDNGDGTYTYSDVVSSSFFTDGQAITVRFYAAKSGIQEFTPGDTAADWSDPVTY